MRASRLSTALLAFYLGTLTAWPVTYTDTFVPGLNMIANHVNTGGNTLDEIFGTSMPDGTTVYFWNKVTQSFSVSQYLDPIGWIPNDTLNPGEGAFLQNPTASPISYTYNGTAPVNAPVTLPVDLYCVLSHKSASPTPATFQDIVGSPPAPGFCTRLYRWNRTLQRYDLFVSTGGPWNPSAPSIPQGESVFIIKASPDNTPPKLVNATINFGTGTILLEFSEPMHPTPAQLIGNYSLTGGPGTIISASLYPITSPPLVESKFVQLTVTGLSTNSVYKLTISGLTDLCGNLIDPCTQIGLNCGTPANDLCVNATTAVLGPNLGTTTCAKTDGSSFCDNICPGGDVWFKYTPPCNGTLTFDTCTSSLDTILSVWNGCPTSFAASELTCDDDSCPPLQSTVTLNVSSCGTLYVRVSGSGGAFGNFVLNVTFTPSAPPNDLCANPIILGNPPLSKNGVYPFNNCNALTDGPGAQPIVNDIWYRYTPTCNGPVFVSTCGSSFDTALAVYAGSCAGTLMGFNNDATSGVCSGSPQSFVTFNAVSGTPYFIRVGSTPSAGTGCGQLVVMGPNPPVGTCPPGAPILGTGVNTVFTRFFEVTGNSSGTPWAWSASAPCCYWLQNLNVPGVPAGSPPSALVSAFVASINAPCPPFPPSPPWFNGRLVATQVAGKFMTVDAYGCNDDIVFSVGPAGTLAQNQCVVPKPADFLPTSGPCSFNPPLAEIPLSKQDCNTNGVDDLIDILQGDSADANGNRVPDECEICERPHFLSMPGRQTVKPGQRAVFNGQVRGGGAITYQWLLNGNPVPGATEAKLIIDPVRTVDAGEYQVAVNYACGQIRSFPVWLTIRGDTLQIQFRDGRVEVTWDANNVYLQSAANVTGSWTTLSNAVSPTVISPPFTQQFFRLIEK